MRCSLLGTMLALSALATGCGEGTLSERILGKKREPPAPFRLDAAKLGGVYTVSGFRGTDGARSVHAFGGKEVRARQEAWRFAEDKVETYRITSDAVACGERAYTVEGLATLVLAATDECAEERVTVLDQRWGNSLTLAREPFQIGDWTFDAVEIRERTTVDLRRELFEWDTDFAGAPAWLAEHAPEEATPEDIEAARTAFRDAALVGKKLTVTADLRDAFGHEDLLRSVVAFKNGKALHWSKLAGEPGDVACYLIVSKADAETYAAGFSLEIASLTLSHSRREGGTWKLDGAAPKLETNPARSNSLQLTFAGAPEGVTMSCERPKGPAVLTIEDVRAALGAHSF